MTISIPLHGTPISAASRYFRASTSQHPKPKESDLLQSIRTALRGSGADLTPIHSTIVPSDEAPWAEQELTWNDHTVVLSTGGVIQKKWNFKEELQAIQWACIGWLEQSSSTASTSSHSAAHYASASQTRPNQVPGPSGRSTFGPFTRAQQQRAQGDERPRVRAVYIFFRSIGKIFLSNGLEFTFSLPFIVRKVWPLYPHGVMIQRILEPNEIEEAEITGDPPLPTIFSMTSPYAEAAAVGLTTGILHGFKNTPASLEDEDENSTKPLKSISASEMVIWASAGGPESSNDVIVTVDSATNQLSIWRYAYIKPKDIPVPLGRSKARILARKRQSISGKSTNRHYSTFVNEGFDRPDRFSPISPDITSEDETSLYEVPELPPLSALPGMPPALTTTTTMDSLLTGGSSNQSPWSIVSKVRRNSLSRNDLSVTMDRMVLGGRIDADTTLAPIEHGRMRAAYWMERLYSQEIADIGWE
jgi:anaphase-promoting complex subunit 1